MSLPQHPRPARLRLRLQLALTLAALLAACAQTPRAPHAPAHWSGRLALQVQDAPTQSFSAGFELQGSAQAGELRLFSPLGGVLALLVWAPTGATLTQGGAQRSAASLHALLTELSGSALPVAALFAWLAGDMASADGWSADLSALERGRLTATREHPAPQATLRVVLDR